MTRIRVLTYATHAEGKFNDMMSDARKHNIPIEVVGWGDKWTSYFGKLKSVQKKIKTFRETDLVIVVDGFDTRIKNNIEAVHNLWKTKFNNAPIVFSKETQTIPIGILSRYITRRCFGGFLNAGLYMGRAKNLVDLYEDAMQYESKCRKDDQCAFNKLVQKHSIVIDTDCLIFNNISYYDRAKDLQNLPGVFCSYPGTFSWKRQMRVPFEYGPIFLPEIIGFVILIYLITQLTTKRLKKM